MKDAQNIGKLSNWVHGSVERNILKHVSVQKIGIKMCLTLILHIHA